MRLDCRHDFHVSIMLIKRKMQKNSHLMYGVKQKSQKLMTVFLGAFDKLCLGDWG
jgi:hypothetical protein